MKCHENLVTVHTLPRDPALQLAALDTACTVEDMDVPGFRLHS